MRPYAFLLFIFVIPTFAFCPKRKHSYDNAIGKIIGKTWCKYKICKNNTCSPPKDSLFFYAFFNDFKNYYSGRTCISTFSWEPYKDWISGAAMGYVPSDGMPLICFRDTTVIGNVFPIYLSWVGNMEKGEISFISDSEFVLNSQIIVGIDSTNTNKNVFSSYYKLVHNSYYKSFPHTR